MSIQKLIFVTLSLFLVSACGKKGDPYVSDPSSFPRPYPRDFVEEPTHKSL